MGNVEHSCGIMYVIMLRIFVEHVYDKPAIAPAEHGLMVQKMLDGLYRSAAERREVAIS